MRMASILYSDVSRSSELTAENLSSRILRLGTRLYSSETFDSPTLKLYSVHHQIL